MVPSGATTCAATEYGRGNRGKNIRSFGEISPIDQISIVCSFCPNQTLVQQQRIPHMDFKAILALILPLITSLSADKEPTTPPVTPPAV